MGWARQEMLYMDTPFVSFLASLFISTHLAFQFFISIFLKGLLPASCVARKAQWR
jgi:hypothetical protein